MSKTLLKQSTKHHAELEDICLTFPNGDKFHVGYSRLSKYFTCPKAYKYTYVDKIRTPGGVPMRRGQAYHGSLETMLIWKMENDGELYSLERAERLAIRQAKKENLTDAEIYRVIDAVRFYWHNVYPKHDPLAVEKDFSVCRGGVTITGRIDLFERMFLRKTEEMFDCTDHKFSYDTWADSRARYGCQPMIYQWAAVDIFEEEFKLPYRGFNYNIIRLYPTPLVQVIHIPRVSQDDSDWWEEQIYEAAKTIRRGYFPAIPSDKACQYCDHKKLCQPSIYKIHKSNIGDPSDDVDLDI